MKILNKYLYEKIAITNIRKNSKLYFPYILCIICSITFFYILVSIGSNPFIYDINTGKAAFKGADTLCIILQSGSFAASVFTSLFLLYANSFVLKHQKKQLGLYRVLGMERKHIIRIICIEILLIFATGLIFSLFYGILFDKLMLVLLFKIINQSVPVGFYLNVNAFIETLKLTGCIVLIILIICIFSVLSSKDIELLKSDKTGEKELKNRPLVAILGIILLAFGYFTALNNTNAGVAINNFFPAAILVMLATEILFTSGSISLLMLLKKNKKFYYNTKHFISISGLLYRMKQNATGLATICILSTAAIIVISAGAALYANGEHSINEMFPRMIKFTSETNDNKHIDNLLTQALNEHELTAQNTLHCTYATADYLRTETGIAPIENLTFTGFNNMLYTFILTLDEYNRFNNTNEQLNNNEILLYISDDSFNNSNLTYLDNTYNIKGKANNQCLNYIAETSMSLFTKLLIVVPDESVQSRFLYSNDLIGVLTWSGFDMNGSEDAIESFTNSLSQKLNENNVSFKLYLKHTERTVFYNMYGGILFVGGMLGFLFIMSTVMIIYYKQISEGYEDRERFIIMQKVGLSKEEIKKSIHSQILLVFFLPLITAIIHSAFALKIVSLCLQLVVIVHTPTFIASTAIVCIIFSIIYMILYKITSKEYYNIVNK